MSDDLEPASNRSSDGMVRYRCGVCRQEVEQVDRGTTEWMRCVTCDEPMRVVNTRGDR